MIDFDFVKLQNTLESREVKSYSRYKNVEVDSSKNKLQVNFENINLFLLMHFENENVKIKIEKNNIMEVDKVIKVEELKDLLIEKGLEVILPNLKKHPALKFMSEKIRN